MFQVQDIMLRCIYLIYTSYANKTIMLRCIYLIYTSYANKTMLDGIVFIIKALKSYKFTF
jgi:hypothetical protein